MKLENPQGEEDEMIEVKGTLSLNLEELEEFTKFLYIRFKYVLNVWFPYLASFIRIPIEIN